MYYGTTLASPPSPSPTSWTKHTLKLKHKRHHFFLFAISARIVRPQKKHVHKEKAKKWPREHLQSPHFVKTCSRWSPPMDTNTTAMVSHGRISSPFKLITRYALSAGGCHRSLSPMMTKDTKQTRTYRRQPRGKCEIPKSAQKAALQVTNKNKLLIDLIHYPRHFFACLCKKRQKSNNLKITPT